MIQKKNIYIFLLIKYGKYYCIYLKVTKYMSKRKQVFAGFKAFIAHSGKFSDASTSTYQKPLTKLHLLPLNSIGCEKEEKKKKEIKYKSFTW